MLRPSHRRTYKSGNGLLGGIRPIHIIYLYRENVPTRIVDADNFRTYVKHQFHRQKTAYEDRLSQILSNTSVCDTESTSMSSRRNVPVWSSLALRVRWWITCDPRTFNKRSHMIDGWRGQCVRGINGVVYQNYQGIHIYIFMKMKDALLVTLNNTLSSTKLTHNCSALYDLNVVTNLSRRWDYVASLE